MISERQVSVLLVLAVTAGSAGYSFAQEHPANSETREPPSKQECRALFDSGSIVMDGNHITTLITKTGVISAPGEAESDLRWNDKGYGYEFGPFIAARVEDESGSIVTIVSDGLRSRGGEPASDSTFWGFEQDWCRFLLNSSPEGQELILVMNDYGNKEFEYFPDPSDTTQRGLGIEVEARFIQSLDSLKIDAIELSYTFTNRGKKKLEEVVLGLWGDPHVGGLNDYHNDSASFDSTLDLLTVWDENSLKETGRPGFLGFTFLDAGDSSDSGDSGDSSDSGDAGNSGDSIGVGLSSFRSSAFGQTSIANDSLIWELVQPGIEPPPDDEGDHVFLFGSTPISLEPGESRRISGVLFFAYHPEDVSRIATKIRGLPVRPLEPCIPGSIDCPPPPPPAASPPTSAFEFSQSDLMVHFREQAIDGDTAIEHWRWEFGDDETSTERNPNHLYDKKGDYIVRLIVKAAGGVSDSTTETVVVPDYCNCPRILEIGLDSVYATLMHVRDTMRHRLASLSIVDADRFMSDAVSSSISTLRDAAGAHVAEVGADRYQISLRSFNTPFDAKPYVMVDRRQGMIPGLGANVYSLLPIAAIDLQRAELIRGPASAEYGSDADDGVIHFTTKNAFDHTGTTFSGDIGESETRALSVRHAQKLGRTFAFKAVGHYSQAKELTFADDDSVSQAIRDQLGLESPEDKVWKAYARGSAVYRPCACISITANADLAAVNQNLPDYAGGGIFADDFKVATGQLLAEVPRGFAQIYYSLTDRGQSVERASGDPFIDNSHLFAAQFEYKVLSHPALGSVVAGFSHSNTTVADVSAIDDSLVTGKTGATGRTATHSDPVAVNQTGFSLDSRVPLPGNFDAHVTMRYDVQDATDRNFFSPRVNLGFIPLGGHRLSVSYNRAFSLNADVALYRGLVTLGAGSVEDLPPTITDAIEFSYHGQFPDRSRIGIDFYYTKRRDQFTNVGPLFGDIIIPLGRITPGDDGGVGADGADGADGAEVVTDPIDVAFNDVSYFGLDLDALLLFWAKWQFFGNLTLLSDNFFDTRNVAEIPEDFAVSMNAPRLRARAGFEHQLTPEISLRAVGRYADSYIVSHGVHLGETDSYFVLDVSFGYKLAGRMSGMRLDVTGRNLLGDEHREFVGVPKVGRTITARLTYAI